MPARMPALRRFTIHFIFTLLLIGMLGCSSGSDDDTSDGGSGTDPLPSEVSQSIKADKGGTITLDNGASVTIAPDALDQDTTITVYPVQVSNLGDAFLMGMRFEPDGTELATPATCSFPLPSTWDGQESPLVYEFRGNDPANFYSTGAYATVSGTPGAYIATTTIAHFSGPALAVNCHSGSWQYLMASMRERGCTSEEIIQKIRNYKDKDGNYPFESMNLPDSKTRYEIDEDTGSEKMIQALATTFFEEVYSFDEGESLPSMSKLFEYTRDEDTGRKVLMGFSSGKWQKTADNFNRHFKHTATLELHNGQIKLRNSVVAPKPIIDALKSKNGGNVFWYPKEGELTTELLEAFREAKPGQALENELCGSPGCLNDPLKNPYGIQWSASIEDRNRMKAPWSAVKIYVERTRLSESPCEAEDTGGEATLKADIRIPGYLAESFSATGDKCAATYSQITDGGDTVELGDIPSVIGYTGSDPLYFDEQLVISLHPSLGGPGTYTFVGSTFDLVDGMDVGMMFAADAIRDQDTLGAMVIFAPVSGTVVVDNFGTEIGDRISGTFSVSVEGEQELCNGDCDDSRIITGTIDGSFDGILTPEEDLR